MYSYKITYDVGDGIYLEALVGMKNNELVYKFIKSSQPLPKETVEGFLELTDFAKAQFSKRASLKEITIKPYKET